MPLNSDFKTYCSRCKHTHTHTTNIGENLRQNQGVQEREQPSKISDHQKKAAIC